MMRNSDESSAIILAAGEARRFGGVRKQLLRIAGETLLERTCRQVAARGVRPIVAVREWAGWDIPFRPVKFVNVGDNPTTCDSALKTARHWKERTIILLGDVCYSKAVMDAIFAETSPLMVYGNIWEIFGFCFDLSEKHKIIDALRAGAEFRGKLKNSGGKLRHFYKAYAGIDMDSTEREEFLIDHAKRLGMFQSVDDYTTDFDWQEKYDNFVRETIQINKLDDLKP